MNTNRIFIRRCPVCNHSNSSQILERDHSPLFRLIPKEEHITDDYFAPLGIVGCNNCGHMFNRMYSEELAHRQYRNEVLSNIPVTDKMVLHLEEIAKLIDEM